jgi:hypothetical protein
MAAGNAGPMPDCSAAPYSIAATPAPVQVINSVFLPGSCPPTSQSVRASTWFRTGAPSRVITNAAALRWSPVRRREFAAPLQPAPTTEQVKAVAYRRIMAVMPEHEQRNVMAPTLDAMQRRTLPAEIGRRPQMRDGHSQPCFMRALPPLLGMPGGANNGDSKCVIFSQRLPEQWRLWRALQGAGSSAPGRGSIR